MDDNARLILLMSEADWGEMRRNPPLTQIQPQKYSVRQVYHLHQNDGEWNPESYPALVAAQSPYTRNDSYNVVFVKTGPDEVRVYIFWFEM